MYYVSYKNIVSGVARHLITKAGIFLFGVLGWQNIENEYCQLKSYILKITEDTVQNMTLTVDISKIYLFI